MRQCLKNSLLAIFFLLTPTFAIGATFLAGTEDVPLPRFLQIDETETFAFDTDEGKLFISKGYTEQSAKQIIDFYTQTLPQLGWTQQKDNSFVREGDTLCITTQRARIDNHELTSVAFQLITKTK